MNKSIRLAIALAVGASVGMAQAATVYCVNDGGINDSQFCYASLPSNQLLGLGPVYENCDIEALDIHHNSDLLFAASGDNTPRKGHIYEVDKVNGNLFDLGNAIAANGENLTEIDAISFHPTTGNMWGWAQHVPSVQLGGLFVIPFIDLSSRQRTQIQSPCSSNPKVEDIPATIVWRPDVQKEIEAITWNWNGTVLYGVENCHTDHPDSHGEGESGWPRPNYDYDFDCGIKLWAGQPQTPGMDDLNSLTEVCQTPSLTRSIDERLAVLYPEATNIPTAEIEALESLPPELSPVPLRNNNDDLVLIGFHGPHHLLYALITIPPIPNPNCELTWVDDIGFTPFNDIEGLAYNGPSTDCTGEVEITGVLTDEGVGCQALRSNRGQLYTLASNALGAFEVGDKVKVCGEIAEISFCMQGTTINVDAIVPHTP